jgi:uncharacterized protein (DUF58 family)
MPTLRGAAALLITVSAWIAAVTWHYDELAVVAAAGVVSLAAGAAWMWWRPRIEVSRVLDPQRVQQGERALSQLVLRDAGHRGLSCSYAIEQLGSERSVIRLPRLRRGGVGTVRYEAPTDRRAVIPIGPLDLVREDALGLFRRTLRVGDKETLYVYPRIWTLAGLPLGLTRSLDGHHRSSVPHGSITFHALREYVRGDDLRHVHWKATSHSTTPGTLMVREHIDTSVAKVILVLDVSRHAYEHQFEEAVEVAASIASVAVGAGNPVEMSTTDGASASSGAAGRHGERLLELLAAVTPSETASLIATVSQLTLRRSRDVLVVVTGDGSPSELASAAGLFTRFGRTVQVTITSGEVSSSTLAGRNRLLLRAGSAGTFASLWNAALVR